MPPWGRPCGDGGLGEDRAIMTGGGPIFERRLPHGTPAPTRCRKTAPGHNPQNAKNGVGWHRSGVDELSQRRGVIGVECRQALASQPVDRGAAVAGESLIHEGLESHCGDLALAAPARGAGVGEAAPPGGFRACHGTIAAGGLARGRWPISRGLCSPGRSRPMSLTPCARDSGIWDPSADSIDTGNGSSIGGASPSRRRPAMVSSTASAATSADLGAGRFPPRAAGFVSGREGTRPRSGSARCPF